jgi:hypothetical protein
VGVAFRTQSQNGNRTWSKGLGAEVGVGVLLGENWLIESWIEHAKVSRSFDVAVAGRGNVEADWQVKMTSIGLGVGLMIF